MQGQLWGLALAPVGVGKEPAWLEEPWQWERSSCRGEENLFPTAWAGIYGQDKGVTPLPIQVLVLVLLS